MHLLRRALSATSNYFSTSSSPQIIFFLLIPIPINNFIFKLRESCRQIKDRKWHSINSIQCHLRSLIFGALTRFNVKLFVGIGITSCVSLAFSSENEALAIRRIADFWEEGEYPIVKEQITQFLTEFPNSSYTDTLCCALADLFLREKNYQLALEHYSQIKEEAIVKKSFLNRMQCLYHLQWHAILADECEAFLQNTDSTLSEKNSVTYFLAIALYQQVLKNPDDQIRFAKRAKPYFETLLETEFAEEISSGFAHILSILEEYANASDLFLKLAKNSEKKDEFLFQAALSQSKYDKNLSIQTFSLLEQSETHGKEATYNLLILLFDLKKHEKILEKKELFLKNVPENRLPIAHFFIGKTLFALENYQMAAIEFQNFLKFEQIDHYFIPALENLTLAAYQINDLTLIQNTLNRLIKLDETSPQTIHAKYLSSRVLKNHGQIQKAIDSLETLLEQFPQFSDKKGALLDLMDYAFQNRSFDLCRKKALQFIEIFPADEFTATGWKYFIRSSFELPNKEQFLQDLEKIQTVHHLFTNEELLDYQYLAAKTYHEMGIDEKAKEALQTILKNPLPFSQKPNAKLLFALLIKETNLNLFCELAKEALLENANLVSEKDLHLLLFNTYLQLENTTEASSHLFEAYKLQAEILLPNLLWLADQYYKHFETDPSFAKEALSIHSYFFQDFKEIGNETLYLEPLAIRTAKLYCHFKIYDKALSLLESVERQYQKEPPINGAHMDETRLELSRLYITQNQIDKAIAILEKMTSSNTFKNAFTATAALELIKLKKESLDEGELPKAITKLKNLTLQRTLQNEPIHLEAALEYIDLQASQNLEKRLQLLIKTKKQFESQDDVLSKDYHEARKLNKDKNEIYLNYLKFMDGEIAAIKSILDQCEDPQVLQEEAKNIFLQIKDERLISRIQLRLKELSR